LSLSLAGNQNLIAFLFGTRYRRSNQILRRPIWR
jgi:hypothetical protein